MARPLRIHFPGAIYHVTGRMLGSWREQRDLLYRDDTDRRRFLKRLEDAVGDFDVRLYLFCLMGNHYHLLLETPKANLSRFMQSVNTGYTVYFNLRHGRHGHLLDGRYKAELVSRDEYLLKLSRYIHQNPVCVAAWARKPYSERVERMRKYRWSSYRGYTGADKSFGFVDEKPILGLTAGRGVASRKAYRDYVESGLAQDDDELRETLSARSLGIGDQDFRVHVERIRNRTLSEQRRPEDLAFRKVASLLEPELVLDETARCLGVAIDELRVHRKNSLVRPIAAQFLIRFAGRTQRETAKLLGLTTGAAVSAQLKRLRGLNALDRITAAAIRRLEGNLRRKLDDK